MEMIGIVGGIGSYAAIDLLRKICDHSEARTDQEHLPVSMISIPNKIRDRSEFLLGETTENPGDSIGWIVDRLFAGGAGIVGIPCNTAHAPPIFEAIRRAAPTGCKILNLIEEVGAFIRIHYPDAKDIGVLSTNGTYHSNVYPETLAKYGLKVIQPSSDVQHSLVHPAVYNATYGIKAFSNPVKDEARTNVTRAIGHLRNRGARLIVLGCTELPLAVSPADMKDCPLVDSTEVLAKALIRESRKMSR